MAVAARLLWVGLTCQSIRGRFSRLTFLQRELSTNTVVVLSLDPEVLDPEVQGY